MVDNVLQIIERLLVVKAIDAALGNYTEAARMLNVSYCMIRTRRKMYSIPPFYHVEEFTRLFDQCKLDYSKYVKKQLQL
jgi:hypothetical protein